MKHLAGLIVIAAIAGAPERADARPITLSCQHSDNVYAAPYTVRIDANNAMLVINDDGRTDVYPIESVKDQKGDRQVTAAGKLLDSHVTVSLSGKKQLWYADAFTDRVFAIDYCD
ncbi:hypothetical protein [Methylocystis parvus]|uniref:Lysozyme inhibitor n=1 Tax=Methylocystis parvus TaxID=134 RepID=A0A6B8M969_9HYPH|nr:hypothetical protein [Methylocystis parvus]QGM99196.1 hypothetical protein F7D14_18040 [Methylocystis parvus]WBK00424.1 hypothetical protein MMG94_01490 [Methylocystis parvus OBBP]